MELHQLRYFLAVVDEGSFTAAAEAVQISQSGISTQIQKLERELGLSLIDRSARRVALTDAGATLVPHARRAVAAVEGVTVAAQEIRGLVVGSLRVATVTGLVWPRLFDALAAVHAQHPGIDIRLREGVSEDHVTAVRDGTVDVAAAAWADDEPAGVEVSVVVDDPLVAVVGRDHPWAGRDRLRPDELAGTDLITLPRGTGSRAALDALLSRRAGRPRDPRWEVATPDYVEMLAARGLGVGVVSATTAQDWDGVVAIPIDDPSARSRFGLVWRSSPSPAARALLGHLVGAQAS
jgi:DNA-binding transcriptional LysR family regulator